MRILIAYPGHSHCTIDVASGYNKALRALGHEVSVFNYHSFLAFYKEALEYWRERNPAFDPNPNAYMVLASERVIVDVVDFVPDVVLIVSGFALNRRAYELIHRLRVPMALLLTESPYADEVQRLICENGHIAVAFTNDKCSLPILPGNVHYLPHSFDPERHYPQEVNSKYQTDVYFHGTLWPERERLFSVIEEVLPRAVTKARGIEPYATSTEDIEAALANYEDNDELARYYCGTKIALNHHRTFVGIMADGDHRHIDVTPHSLGPRAYEIAACGAFQLCDDTRPELDEVFGDSVAAYHGRADLGEHLRYWLDHPAERQARAAESLRRVQDCTFEKRARDIVIPALQEIV